MVGLFTGLGETIGGLLLVLKRTSLLGALILVAILSNVVILNLTFDIPVKLFSIHLLLTTFFVIYADLKRLVHFLLNKPTKPAIDLPLLANPRNNRWIIIVSGFLIIVVTFYMFYLKVEGLNTYQASKSPYHGIWNVEEFEIGGEIQPPLLSNETRWRRVVFNSRRNFHVQLVNDRLEIFYLSMDEKKDLHFNWI